MHSLKHPSSKSLHELLVNLHEMHADVLRSQLLAQLSEDSPQDVHFVTNPVQSLPDAPDEPDATDEPDALDEPVDPDESDDPEEPDEPDEPPPHSL
jgi:hypothetical protein